MSRPVGWLNEPRHRCLFVPVGADVDALETPARRSRRGARPALEIARRLYLSPAAGAKDTRLPS